MKIIKDIHGNFRGFYGTGKELKRFCAKIQDREFNERLRRARERVVSGANINILMTIGKVAIMDKTLAQRRAR